mmetsp:Transcript_3621/g.8586  ORF Transcript_3621/g.8586 Transcript_3621/m.8586 type:complete len:423 (+) Transcript_3621:210-1478(+)
MPDQYKRLAASVATRLRARGITKPTPVQEVVIPKMLDRENVLVSAETGSGKTGSFLWPLASRIIHDRTSKLVRERKTTRVGILVPSRELAEQIFCEARYALGRPLLESEASASHETFDVEDTKESSTALLVKRGIPGEREIQVQFVKAMDPSVIIGTPQWLLDVLQEVEEECTDTEETGHIKQRTSPFYFDALVVDECDKVLKPLSKYSPLKKIKSREIHGNAGVDFVNRSVQTNPDTHLAMFSATVNRRLRSLAHKQKWNLEYIKIGVTKGFTVPQQIRHLYAPCDGMDIMEAFQVIFNESSNLLSLLVIDSRSSPVKMVEVLSTRFAINAMNLFEEVGKGMDDFRARLDKLAAKKQPVLLVATNEILRGIDLPDLDQVFMLGPPKDSNTYLHMAGRTGRFGRKGNVTVLLSSYQDEAKKT